MIDTTPALTNLLLHIRAARGVCARVAPYAATLSPAAAQRLTAAAAMLALAQGDITAAILAATEPTTPLCRRLCDTHRTADCVHCPAFTKPA